MVLSTPIAMMQYFTSQPVTADNASARSRITMPMRASWKMAKLALPSLRKPESKRISRNS